MQAAHHATQLPQPPAHAAPPRLTLLDRHSVDQFAAVARTVFPGAVVETSGWLHPTVVVRGYARGVPVEVIASVVKKRRGGTVPWLEVVARGSTGGATAELVHYRGPDAAYETSAHLPGADEHRRIAGAPFAFVHQVANGVFAARTACVDAARYEGLRSLGVGPRAARLADDGVRVGFRGWPADPDTLMFLIDMAIGVLEDARAFVQHAPGQSAALHPEVVAYRAGRERGSRIGKLILAAVLLGGIVSSTGFAVLLSAMMMR